MQKAVVDLVHVGEVIDRSALGVFAVHAVLIHEDGVKADVVETGNLLYAAQVVAVALAEGKIGAA